MFRLVALIHSLLVVQWYGLGCISSFQSVSWMHHIECFTYWMAGPSVFKLDASTVSIHMSSLSLFTILTHSHRLNARLKLRSLDSDTATHSAHFRSTINSAPVRLVSSTLSLPYNSSCYKRSHLPVSLTCLGWHKLCLMMILYVRQVFIVFPFLKHPD